MQRAEPRAAAATKEEESPAATAGKNSLDGKLNDGGGYQPRKSQGALLKGANHPSARHFGGQRATKTVRPTVVLHHPAGQQQNALCGTRGAAAAGTAVW